MGVAEYEGSLPHVASDDRNDAANVAKKMLALGHTRIVHLTRHLTSKLEGFLEACELDGHAVPYRYVVQADGLEIEDGRIAMLEFLDKNLPFTAVFGATDHLALGAMLALRERELSIPADVSVVGFDGLPARTPGLPALSTMSVPRELIGEQAAELLAAMSKGHKLPESIPFLPSRWIEVKSLSTVRTYNIDLPVSLAV
jgi:DNA-binding LacI/PurR family transcriptional regulator